MTGAERGIQQTQQVTSLLPWLLTAIASVTEFSYGNSIATGCKIVKSCALGLHQNNCTHPSGCSAIIPIQTRLINSLGIACKSAFSLCINSIASLKKSLCHCRS